MEPLRLGDRGDPAGYRRVSTGPRACAVTGTIHAAWFAVVLLVVLGAACARSPDHEVEAHWARGERPPDALIENSTPDLSDEGISLSTLRCDITDDELHYELDLTNPYTDTFDTWAFTSLDGPNQGHLWGLYQFSLPPGEVRVTFPDVLDIQERQDVFDTARAEVGDDLVACSIVFLGVSDSDEAAFVHPVITTDLPR